MTKLPVLPAAGPPAAMNVNLKLVGSNCNMRCTYCYEHDDPRWAREILRPEEVGNFLSSVPSGTHLRFLLHGGEPLLYPKREMVRLFKIIEERVGTRASLHLQTNGTLLDEEWIELFRAHDPDFVFSLSVDTLREDVNRKLPGRAFVPVIKEKLGLLKARGAVVGVVSVISRANIDAFEDFIEELIRLGVRFLTVSKLRRNTAERAGTNGLVLPEIEYVSFLERLFRFWVERRLFRQLHIQPFMTLLSKSANRICTFQDGADKCVPFVSLYPGGLQTGCDHRGVGLPRLLPECPSCPIAEWCGGGCFGEEKDATFCSARFRLKSFVEAVST
jgi:uncharacterized protein